MMEKIFQTMNTIAQIKVEGNDGENALNQAEAVILDCEKRFNYFSKYSEISTLCENICITEKYNISLDLFEMLKVANRVKKETGGLFDVDYKNNDIHKDYHLENGNKIIFDSNKTKLNLGAIAKGFTADKAIEKIKEHDINRAMISMGGHIACYTKERSWKVGLQDPSKEFGQLIGSLEIANESISTSAENYRGKHIANPVESDWISSAKSLSVVFENGMLADAYSTALFLSDEKTREMLIQKYKLNVIIISGDIIRVSKGLARKFILMNNNFKKENC